MLIFGVAIGFFLIMLMIQVSFSLEFNDYTSERYKISFRYPSHWNITEKTDMFANGTEIELTNNNLSSWHHIFIYYDNNMGRAFGSWNLDTAVLNSYEESLKDFMGNKYMSIESPKFMTIDEKRAGTYSYIYDDFEGEPNPWVTKVWVVFVADHSYDISFGGPANTFDTHENKIIRDEFIKSIKFIDGNNKTKTK